MSTIHAPLAVDAIVFGQEFSTGEGAASPLFDVDLDVLPGEIWAIARRGRLRHDDPFV
jgi:hypothetical protein